MTAPSWARTATGAELSLDDLRAESFAATKVRMGQHFPGRSKGDIGALAKLERSRVNCAWQALRAEREGDKRKALLYNADAGALRWALDQIHSAIPGHAQAFVADMGELGF